MWEISCWNRDENSDQLVDVDKMVDELLQQYTHDTTHDEGGPQK